MSSTWVTVSDGRSGDVPLSAYGEVCCGKRPSTICSRRNGLRMAALHNHVDLVHYFINEKKSGDYDVGVGAAAEGGHLELVKYFRDRCRGQYLSDDIVYYAAYRGHKAIVEYLISKSVGDWHAALRGALRGNHKDLIDYCVSKGGINDHMVVCNSNDFADIYEYFVRLSEKTNLSYLSEAAELGHMELVKYYVNSTYWTRLYWATDAAISGGHLDVFKYMLEVEREKSELRRPDWNSYMALAAEYDRLNIIEYCIEQGANNWNAGLRGAVEGGHFHLVQYFIDKGADDDDFGFSCEHGDIGDYFSNAYRSRSRSPSPYRKYGSGDGTCVLRYST